MQPPQTTSRTTAERRWFIAPLIGTGVTLLLAPIVGFWYSLIGLAFDACGPDDCPRSTAQVETATWLIIAAVGAILAGWAVAYPLPAWVRPFVAAVAPILLLAALYLILTLPTGQ